MTACPPAFITPGPSHDARRSLPLPAFPRGIARPVPGSTRRGRGSRGQVVAVQETHVSLHRPRCWRAGVAGLWRAGRSADVLPRRLARGGLEIFGWRDELEA